MSKASVEIIKGNGSVSVVGKGEMDLEIGKQFDEALAEAVASGKPVEVDLTEANFIDSAIVQAFAQHGKTMYDRGMRMKVVIVSNSYPEYVLTTVGFNVFLDIEAKPTSS